MSDPAVPEGAGAPVLADRAIAGLAVAAMLTAAHACAACWTLEQYGRHLAAPFALFGYEFALVAPAALLRALLRGRGRWVPGVPPAAAAFRDVLGMGLFGSLLLTLALEAFLGPMAGKSWPRVAAGCLGALAGWWAIGVLLRRCTRGLRNRAGLVRIGLAWTAGLLLAGFGIGLTARTWATPAWESPTEACRRAEAVVPEASPGLAAPSGRRVVVIGIDGADLDEALPLLRQGALPNLRSLIEDGVGLRLWSDDYVLGSPALWTTIATGVRPATHRIEAMLTVIAPGLAAIEIEPDFIGPLNTPLLLLFTAYLALDLVDATPPPSNCRAVPALGNVVSESGGSVRVIGWPTTWPAEAVHGEVVTERARRAPHVEVFRPFQGHACGLAYPGGLFRRLHRDVPGHSDVPWEDLERLAEWTEADRADLGRWSMSLTERRPLAFLSMVLAGDRWIGGVATRLLRDEGPRDLTLCAFYGVDIAAHYWYDAAYPARGQVLPAERLRYRDIIPGTWKLTDRWIGEILAQLDRDTTVIVLSDHGMERAALLDFVAYHSRDGLLFARGPGIARLGLVAESRAHIEDVAPTVLRLLGYPVPPHCEGRVLDEILTSGPDSPR